jgi:osmotically-inducible protein OsmY
MKPTVSDTLLRDAVVNELERDPEVVAKHISVAAIDGAIALGGHVMTIHEKHVAVRAAERVDAVRAVADDIEVREPSLHERADDEIAEEIAHLRSWGAQIPDSVAAQVRDGRVILHGEVESESQRDTAESAVRQLTGVCVVDNLIKVRAQAEPTAADLEHRVQGRNRANCRSPRPLHPRKHEKQHRAPLRPRPFVRGAADSPARGRGRAGGYSGRE